MQILKYTFYFIILAAISISVYILTLDNQFNINDKFEVNVKEVYARNYINDLQNWTEIFPLETSSDSLNSHNKTNDKVSIQLDSTYLNNSLFSVYLSGTKIGDLTYNFTDTLNTKTKIMANFIGEVSFTDKISIFLKGISPNHYFNKVLIRVNDNIQNQINTDFEYKNFEPVKTDSISKSYYYKSLFASNKISREKIINDYNEVKKAINPKNITNNLFYLNILNQQPERVEYYIGIPVNNKDKNTLNTDIFLDSIQPGKIIKYGFSGSKTFEKEYNKIVEKETNLKKIEIDQTKAPINVWSNDLKSSNPKKWHFQTYQYIKTQTSKNTTPKDSLKNI